MHRLQASKPDPDELLKLFPSETRSDWHLRAPYHAFFIFFGYYLGNSWTLCYSKTNSYKRYNKISNSKPNSLIKKVYKLYVPWLLWRAEVLKRYFEKGKNEFRSIQDLFHEGLIDDELEELLSCTYQEINYRKSSTFKTNNHKELTFVEKMIWFHMKEVQILDSISFNLSESSHIMEEVMKSLDEVEDFQELSKNIDSIFSHFI